MKSERWSSVLLSVGVLAGSGCSGGDPAADPALNNMKMTRDEMPHEIAVLIDAGNAAFSSGDYETARQHYRGAAARDTAVAAAWYGLAMAERALGNDAAADSALQRLSGLGEAADVHHPASGAGDPAMQSPHAVPSSPHSPHPKTDPSGT